jgi:hypothetical protein
MHWNSSALPTRAGSVRETNRHLRTVAPFPASLACYLHALVFNVSRRPRLQGLRNVIDKTTASDLVLRIGNSRNSRFQMYCLSFLAVIVKLSPVDSGALFPVLAVCLFSGNDGLTNAVIRVVSKLSESDQGEFLVSQVETALLQQNTKYYFVYFGKFIAALPNGNSMWNRFVDSLLALVEGKYPRSFVSSSWTRLFTLMNTLIQKVSELTRVGLLFSMLYHELFFTPIPAFGPSPALFDFFLTMADRVWEVSRFASLVFDFANVAPSRFFAADLELGASHRWIVTQFPPGDVDFSCANAVLQTLFAVASFRTIILAAEGEFPPWFRNLQFLFAQLTNSPFPIADSSAFAQAVITEQGFTRETLKNPTAFLQFLLSALSRVCALDSRDVLPVAVLNHFGGRLSGVSSAALQTKAGFLVSEGKWAAADHRLFRCGPISRPSPQLPRERADRASAIIGKFAH